MNEINASLWKLLGGNEKCDEDDANDDADDTDVQHDFYVSAMLRRQYKKCKCTCIKQVPVLSKHFWSSIRCLLSTGFAIVSLSIFKVPRLLHIYITILTIILAYNNDNNKTDNNDNNAFDKADDDCRLLMYDPLKITMRHF